MPRTTEFEIKARLDDLEALAALIPSTPPLTERTSQVDVYYDTPERMLYQMGIFLRVRNAHRIELKAAPQSAGIDHLWCGERRARTENDAGAVTEIAHFLSAQLARRLVPCQNLGQLLHAFNLEAFLEIRKDRLVYHLEGVEVAVDEVEGLGTFIEVEVYDPSRREYYCDVAKKAGLVHLPVGYVELLLREREPQTYRRGRYMLLEDRDMDLPCAEGDG